MTEPNKERVESFTFMKFGANLDQLRDIFETAMREPKNAKATFDVPRARRHLVRMLELLG
jgi:hypothetical protein